MARSRSTGRQGGLGPMVSYSNITISPKAYPMAGQTDSGLPSPGLSPGPISYSGASGGNLARSLPIVSCFPGTFDCCRADIEGANVGCKGSYFAELESEKNWKQELRESYRLHAQASPQTASEASSSAASKHSEQKAGREAAGGMVRRVLVRDEIRPVVENVRSVSSEAPRPRFRRGLVSLASELFRTP